MTKVLITLSILCLSFFAMAQTDTCKRLEIELKEAFSNCNKIICKQSTCSDAACAIEEIASKRKAITSYSAQLKAFGSIYQQAQCDFNISRFANFCQATFRSTNNL